MKEMKEEDGEWRRRFLRGRKECFLLKVFKKLVGRMNGRMGKWVKLIDFRIESLVDRIRFIFVLRGDKVNINVVD